MLREREYMLMTYVILNMEQGYLEVSAEICNILTSFPKLSVFQSDVLLSQELFNAG
jgi:hypothetical protein